QSRLPEEKAHTAPSGFCSKLNGAAEQRLRSFDLDERVSSIHGQAPRRPFSCALGKFSNGAREGNRLKHMVRSLLVFVALAAMPVYAQYEPTQGDRPSDSGALNSQMLKSLQGAVPVTPQLRAVRDALAKNSVHSLAINPDVENRTDTLFSHEIKDPGSIANQDKSGRCWLFAGLNMLRPGVIAKEKLKDF